jgi:hypothetical protein
MGKKVFPVESLKRGEEDPQDRPYKRIPLKANKMKADPIKPHVAHAD